MEIAESFSSVFDKAPCVLIKSQCEIHEQNQGASFTNLKLVNDGEEIFLLDNKFYKNSHEKILDWSSNLSDLDSDGFLITEIKGRKSIVVSELKSALDSRDLLKAYKQIVFTYIKCYMLLSLCSTFQAEEFDIIGIIACKPPKDKKQNDYLKDTYLQLMNSSLCSIQPDVRLMVRLFMEKHIKTKLGNIPFLKTMNLHNDLSSSSFRLYLLMPDSYEKSEMQVNLVDLLKSDKAL